MALLINSCLWQLANQNLLKIITSISKILRAVYGDFHLNACKHMTHRTSDIVMNCFEIFSHVNKIGALTAFPKDMHGNMNYIELWKALNYTHWTRKALFLPLFRFLHPVFSQSGRTRIKALKKKLSQINLLTADGCKTWLHYLCHMLISKWTAKFAMPNISNGC